MKQRDVLNFWRDVEVFNLPDFNKESSALPHNALLPWEKDMRPLRNPKYNVWRFTLLFGRIPKKEVIHTIEGLLKVEEPPKDWEEPVTGHTCLSALLLDGNGQPDVKSYIPAAFIFGIRCLEENAPMTAVSEKLEEAQSDFELRYNVPPVAEEEQIKKGPAVTWKHLQQEIVYLDSVTKGWNKTPVQVFVVAKEVPKDAEPDTSFLNSFFLSDLNMLINTTRRDYGTALDRYLSITTDESKRKDLIENREFLCASLNPEWLPPGRWPAKTAYGLYAAQSGAVNTVLADLKGEAGIKGINGPPGTGKTTLLLDIIADVVVTRALNLMQTGPDELFARFTKIEKEEGFSGYFGLTSNVLYDSGIVVASNNNAAVENITKALPSIAKIDNDEFNSAGYFAVYAQRLIEEESWGILSAALGNAQNRSNFKWKFWLSDTENDVTGFQDMLWSIYKTAGDDQTIVYRQKFYDTKEELQKLISEFDLFKQKAAYFHQQYPVFKNNKRQQLNLENSIREVNAAITALSHEEGIVKMQIEEVNELIRLAEIVVAHIKDQKPSFFFFQKLLKTQAYRKWKIDYDHNMNELRDLVEKKSLLVKKIHSIQSELGSNRRSGADMEEKLDRINKSIAQYLELMEALHVHYGIDYKNLVSEEFYNKPLEEIQLRTPYSSELINGLRSNIFLKSLELHQYCILSNAKKVRNNLSLFFEMMEGRVQVKESIAQTLWGTLFLCIPVVSTTLASVSRLFSSMGKESIGWLLLDEAGQATPQSAAGIIWRSKRCIIVGDPLQIEPVVTIPKKLISRLRQQEGVDALWSPSNSSVQLLADRVSEKGTYMLKGDSDDKVWAGFPLRTHRRCDNPMFGIANEIAYANQMVKATKDITNDGYIGPSAWFHIVAGSAPVNKHVLTDEITLLREKMYALRAAGFQGEIFVISPFKSVAGACVEEFGNMTDVSCGTIHTFQGKEADVVFMVLGGNPASQGARDWASEKPNMLNVALTRAKKRFYVIGNRNLWAACNYFDVLAARLPYVNI